MAGRGKAALSAVERTMAASKEASGIGNLVRHAPTRLRSIAPAVGAFGRSLDTSRPAAERALYRGLAQKYMAGKGMLAPASKGAAAAAQSLPAATGALGMAGRLALRAAPVAGMAMSMYGAYQGGQKAGPWGAALGTFTGGWVPESWEKDWSAKNAPPPTGTPQQNGPKRLDAGQQQKFKAAAKTRDPNMAQMGHQTSEPRDRDPKGKGVFEGGKGFQNPANQRAAQAAKGREWKGK